MESLKWFAENKEVMAVGIVLLGGFLVFFFDKNKNKNKNKGSSNISNSNINNNNIVIGGVANGNTNNVGEAGGHNIKDKTHIMFIDDDTSFPVVKILRKAGWRNTKIVKDITSLDAADVRDAHIFFVDIQGVGKALSFKDEGLGVAVALKKKYPDKKVVIYSAVPIGDRFHEGFRVADDQLSKTADPYQFQQAVETLSAKSAQ